MIKLNLKKKQYLLNDHLSSELLTEGSNVTKSEFVTEFVNTIHRNGGSIKLSNEIFHLLPSTFVNSKLSDIVFRKNLKLIKTTITQHHSNRTLTTRPRYGIRPNCIKPRSASGATSDIRELTSFGSKTFCLT